MASFAYYLFNAVIFVPVAVLSLITRVRLFGEWKNLLRAYAYVSLPFIIWDIWAASKGHWLFSQTYITSVRILGLPIEELLFFVTVPFAMMFVWRTLIDKFKQPLVVQYSPLVKKVIIGLIVGLLVCAVFVTQRAYTFCALVAAAATFLNLLQTKYYTDKRFWYFQGLLLVLFVVSNTLLTALPVILYGPQAIVGFRIGTIPIEDFLFNFALITLFLTVFTRGHLLTKAV